MSGSQTLRVMVLEDDLLLALDLADTLRAAGFELAGPFASIDVALHAIAVDQPHVAILDIDLNGCMSFPVADALQSANVPFFWLSASSPDVVPERYQARPFLSKPFGTARLLRTVNDLVRRE